VLAIPVGSAKAAIWAAILTISAAVTLFGLAVMIDYAPCATSTVLLIFIAVAAKSLMSFV